MSDNARDTPARGVAGAALALIAFPIIAFALRDPAQPLGTGGSFLAAIATGLVAWGAGLTAASLPRPTTAGLLAAGLAAIPPAMLLIAAAQQEIVILHANVFAIAAFGLSLTAGCFALTAVAPSRRASASSLSFYWCGVAVIQLAIVAAWSTIARPWLVSWTGIAIARNVALSACAVQELLTAAQLIVMIRAWRAVDAPGFEVGPPR